MAEYIPFQPVIFDESLDECLLNTSGYSMPVQAGDNTQFQLLIEPCASSPDIVTNGTFASSSGWSLGSNWSIAANIARHTAGAGGTLTQNVPFTSSAFYEITVTFNNVTSGSCQVKCGLTTKGTVSANGTYTFNQDGLIFGSGLNFVASSDFQGDIVFVSCLVYNVNYLKVVIYNIDGTQAAVLDYSDGYFNVKAPYLTVTIDWDALGLSYGCYYIGVADDCLNTCSQLYIADQTFYNTNFWTRLVNNNATTTLTLSSNEWTYASTSVNGSGSLTSVGELCSGKSYLISYKLKGRIGNTSMTIKCGTQSGTTRTSSGVYTETIVSNGNSFSINFASTTNPSQWTIYDFSVIGLDSELTTDYVSNKFVYSADTNCTKMISAVCDENSFGMGFVNTGFIPRVRVESKLVLSGYPQERIKTKTSQGLKRVDFFSGDKNWRLRILRQPEHVMDFLALLIGFDHWYIDSVEYFAAEDEFAEPKPNKFFNVYDVDIECQKKTLLLQNKNCSDNIEVGSLTAQDVLTSSGGHLTTSTGLQVTLSSRQ